MKTLTIDFDLYEQELNEAKCNGYRDSFYSFEQIILTLIKNVRNNESAEKIYNIVLDHLDEEHELAVSCAKIIDSNFKPKIFTENDIPF